MSTKRLTVGAFFMALMIILSSSMFSVPVPGGHFYFNTILIFLVCLYFEPWEAVVIAGVGSFLGDLFFYPAPMFVTLVTHSIQAFVMASLIGLGKRERVSFTQLSLAFVVGGIIDIVGYFIGRSYLYATPSYASLKLPFDIIAFFVGAALAIFLYYRTPLTKMIMKALK